MKSCTSLEVGDRINSVSYWEGSKAAALWRDVPQRLNAAAGTLRGGLWHQWLSPGVLNPIRFVGGTKYIRYPEGPVLSLCLLSGSIPSVLHVWDPWVPPSLFSNVEPGNETFQRDFSGPINLRSDTLDTPVLEIHNAYIMGWIVSPPQWKDSLPELS